MDKARLQDEIARVAYGLFEKRGCIDGHAREDWLEAEKIVTARHAKTAGAKEVTPAGVKKTAATKEKVSGKASTVAAKPKAAKPAATKGKKAATGKK